MARRSAIDFLPDAAPDWPLDGQAGAAARRISTRLLGELLPDRLAEALAKKIGLWGELANLPDAKLRDAERRLARLALPPERHRRLRQGRGDGRRNRHRRPLLADDGGRKVPGLYAIGEAVDVTGWLGGYNFQWAWASGWAAAQVL